MLTVTITLIGFIWIVIEGFSVSKTWGVICFLLPIIFLIFHFKKAYKPFLMLFIGSIIMEVFGWW